MQKVLFSCKTCNSLPQVVSYQKGRSVKNRVFRVYCPTCTNSSVPNTAFYTNQVMTAEIYNRGKIAAKKVSDGVFLPQQDAFNLWNGLNNPEIIDSPVDTPILEKMVDPFWAGFSEALESSDEEMNPYVEGTKKYDEWMDGFEIAINE